MLEKSPKNLKVGQVIEVKGNCVYYNGFERPNKKSDYFEKVKDGKYVVSNITYRGAPTFHTSYGTSISYDWWGIAAKSVDDETYVISFDY